MEVAVSIQNEIPTGQLPQSVISEVLPLWAPNTAYTVGQQIAYENKHYTCITAHTSGTTFTGTDWQELGLGLIPEGGTAGQALTKNTSTNFDAGWSTTVSLAQSGQTPSQNPVPPSTTASVGTLAEAARADHSHSLGTLGRNMMMGGLPHVKLPAPVTCKALRVSATASSYGGEPDASAIAAGGQGNSTQVLTLQQIACLCDDNTRLQIVLA